MGALQIFVLSAIAPEKMPAVLRNLKAVLKVRSSITRNASASFRAFEAH